MLATPRRLAILIAVLLLFFPATHASAHSLDMYAQTQAIQLTRAGLQVDWKITPGPLLASTDWDEADQNQDGKVSQAEARAWLTTFFSQWTVSLDGQTPDPVQVTDIQWPTSPDLFQSGEEPIEIHLQVKWPESLSGSHSLEIHNANQEAISLNWFSLTAGDGLSFSDPAQSNGRLDVKISAGPGNAAGSLTFWESGQPNLSGVTGALAAMAGNLAKPGTAPQPASSLSGPTAALAGLVRIQNFSPLFLAGAFLLSLALGSLHALTPGHGKTLVAAYLVGSHGRTRDAIFLGSIVTLTHTGSVLIFGFLTMLASRFIFPSLIAPWLEVISGLLVVGFGLSLLITRGRSLYAWYQSERTKRLAGHFRNIRLAASPPPGSQPRYAFRSAPASHEHPHPEGYEHDHDHADHDHAEAGQAHSHPHSHALPSDQVTWKSLLTLGVSGGLVPCPDAIAILVVAVALGRIPLGMFLIVAFSLGLAFVLIAIGIAMVQGVRLIKRNDLLNRFSIYAPVLSAVVVLGLGIALSLSAFNSVKASSTILQANPSAPSSLSSSGPVFNIKQAKVVYLSQDAQGRYQLTTFALGGGAPQVLTSEPSGVDGYAVSPDGKMILYTVIDLNGNSSMKAISPDGSAARPILNCSQAQCEQPVWYPGSQKVIYERLDYSINSVAPMFSIWWLDLATGETKPVFQDQAFPALAPAFSADGQWLSYVSPATNTLQLYNLLKTQAISIPISNQAFSPEEWSPSGDAILFSDPANSQLNAAMHMKRYILASGQKVDLGGSAQQADYNAAWSPDGQWVAINRDKPDATSTSVGEEIWLVRPDGSQGHTLVVGQDSYSDMNWSPDSAWLVFSRTIILGNSQPEIWLANIRSGQLTKVLSGGINPALVP
ncbi:MAG: sulfite exporter TauE/SafE family protein [Anaerolineales bacterium]